MDKFNPMRPIASKQIQVVFQNPPSLHKKRLRWCQEGVKQALSIIKPITQATTVSVSITDREISEAIAAQVRNHFYIQSGKVFESYPLAAKFTHSKCWHRRPDINPEEAESLRQLDPQFATHPQRRSIPNVSIEIDLSCCYSQQTIESLMMHEILHALGISHLHRHYNQYVHALFRKEWSPKIIKTFLSQIRSLLIFEACSLTATALFIYSQVPQIFTLLSLGVSLHVLYSNFTHISNFLFPPYFITHDNKQIPLHSWQDTSHISENLEPEGLMATATLHRNYLRPSPALCSILETLGYSLNYPALEKISEREQHFAQQKTHRRHSIGLSDSDSA